MHTFLELVPSVFPISTSLQSLRIGIFRIHLNQIGLGLAVRCNIGKKREHGVIILCRDRVDLVVVATGTPDGHTQKDLPRGTDDIIQVIKFREGTVGRFIIPDAEALISGGGDGCGIGIGQFIPGNVLKNEAVIGLILVKGIYHIVPVPPDFRLIPIAFIPVGFRIAHQVEPVPAPFFPVVWRGKQAVDQLTEFIPTLVFHISFHFGGTGRKSS